LATGPRTRGTGALDAGVGTPCFAWLVSYSAPPPAPALPGGSAARPHPGPPRRTATRLLADPRVPAGVIQQPLRFIGPVPALPGDAPPLRSGSSLISDARTCLALQPHPRRRKARREAPGRAPRLPRPARAYPDGQQPPSIICPPRNMIGRRLPLMPATTTRKVRPSSAAAVPFTRGGCDDGTQTATSTSWRWARNAASTRAAARALVQVRPVGRHSIQALESELGTAALTSRGTRPRPAHRGWRGLCAARRTLTSAAQAEQAVHHTRVGGGGGRAIGTCAHRISLSAQHLGQRFYLGEFTRDHPASTCPAVRHPRGR